MNLQIRDHIVTIMCDKIEQLRAQHNQDWNLYDLANAIVTQLKLQPEHDHGTTYPNIPVRDRRLVRYVTEWRDDD